MDKSQVTKKLEEVIREVLPEINDIDMNVSISKEYGVNSMSLIEIIVATEKKFDVSFTDFELALPLYDTFDDLVTLIEEKIS